MKHDSTTSHHSNSTSNKSRRRFASVRAMGAQLADLRTDLRTNLRADLRDLRADLRIRGRLARDLLSCATDPYRPIVVNLIVTRRCNLSCSYCFEYDKVSPPVPIETLKERVDHLRRLRAVIVTLTGGETLLHPDLEELVGYIRDSGMTPVMNTNAYLLTRARVLALNEAGLFAMQISVDNVRPNESTKKSLKPLLPRLRMLAENATFRVRINTVLGSGPPEEAVEVARVVTELGFDAKCSLLRDEDGVPVAIDDRTRRAYDEIRAMGRRGNKLLSEDFQMPIIERGRIDWKCRAGARFFHVCENGLVHLCAPRTGLPGKPLADYDEADIRREFHTPKSCSAKCPVAYAHQASRIDWFRGQSESQDDSMDERAAAVTGSSPMATPAMADPTMVSVKSLVSRARQSAESRAA